VRHYIWGGGGAFPGCEDSQAVHARPSGTGRVKRKQTTGK
jgi:hypothetical protein